MLPNWTLCLAVASGLGVLGFSFQWQARKHLASIAWNRSDLDKRDPTLQSPDTTREYARMHSRLLGVMRLSRQATWIWAFACFATVFAATLR